MRPGGYPQYPPPKTSNTGLIIAIVAVVVMLFAGLVVGAIVVFVNSTDEKAAEKYSPKNVPTCASIAQQIPGLPQGRPIEVPAGITPEFGWTCTLTDYEDPKAVHLNYSVYDGDSGLSEGTGTEDARKEFAGFVNGEPVSLGFGEEAVWSAVLPIGAVRPGVQCELHIRDGNAVLGVGAFDASGEGTSMADCRATVEAAIRPFYDALQPR